MSAVQQREPPVVPSKTKRARAGGHTNCARRCTGKQRQERCCGENRPDPETPRGVRSRDAGDGERVRRGWGRNTREARGASILPASRKLWRPLSSSEHKGSVIQSTVEGAQLCLPPAILSTSPAGGQHRQKEGKTCVTQGGHRTWPAECMHRKAQKKWSVVKIYFFNYLKSVCATAAI